MQKTFIGRLIFLAFTLTALAFPLAYADRGMIPIQPQVSVYEPGQKAIIAWNGAVEILILSTDVTANSETVVLELLPLPSKPKVEAASFASFEEIQSLIWQEGIDQYFFSEKGQARSGSVEIIFHEQIGAHNITVVKAENANELIEWIGQFLKANGIEKAVSLGDFEKPVKDYIGRGFRYYVLDLITVTPKEKSIEPILYKFNSNFLYYPLAITSPVKGETKLTLFLLTKEKINGNYLPLQKAYYQILGKAPKPIEFPLSKGELYKIDLRIGELFDDGAWLTVLKYEGKLSWLTKDLMITEEYIRPSDTINVEVTIPPTLVALLILLGAACTIAGSAITILITRARRDVQKS